MSHTCPYTYSLVCRVYGEDDADNFLYDCPKALTELYRCEILDSFFYEVKRNLPLGRLDFFDYARVQLFALGKLALQGLETGSSVFHESDLRQHGVNTEQASLFSHIYTVFNEEEYENRGEARKFCFVHPCVQMFVAAWYIFILDENNAPVSSHYQHHDLLLRFLTGLNVVAVSRLVTYITSTFGSREYTPWHDRIREDIIGYIKDMIKTYPAPDTCRNLFYCPNELNDVRILVEETEGLVKISDALSGTVLPSQWALFVFALRTSEEELTQLRVGMGSYAARAAKRADLSACSLTESSCDCLSSLLSSSRIQWLDLSFNHISDAGLHKLCGAIRDSPIHTLRLKGCGLTELGAASLSSLLSTAQCKLKCLDVSDNDCGDEGVQRLSEALSSPHCGLEVLSLSLCRVTERGCTFLAAALNGSVLKELDLSYNHPGRDGLQLLRVLAEDPHCSLSKISAKGCSESRIGPGPKKYAVKLTLDPSTAHKDLSLSDRNRKATRELNPAVPIPNERFGFWNQVLCTKGLTGRCYWETEVDGRACVGVAYARMPRKGEGAESRLGQNESSWGLNCNREGFKAAHNGVVTAVPGSLKSNRIGVLLDWRLGKLSFFGFHGGESFHIFTFEANFTFPVVPAFHLAWMGSSIHLC